jgi:twitching motility protein PilT
MAYPVEEIGMRFRVNVFWQQNYVGAVMRAIPIEIPSIEELGLPPILKNLIELPRGIILITGPTGSGKSTTLAAMINRINSYKRCNIVTIEDPIEFVFVDKTASIVQRELGVDTHSFAAALKHVTRENPDIIMVGEMRDLETIQSALTAAEMGHLVLSTLHTTDAIQTVNRIIDVFPPEQQHGIRAQLAVTIAAVLSQTLLLRKDGTGRVPAFEIMIGIPAVRSLIREGKTYQIYSILQTSGVEYGMITLDQYLLNLYFQNIVGYEEALGKASNPAEFMQRAKLGSLSPMKR